MIKITIDTSVIANETSPTLEYLVLAHEQGLLDVGVTSRFRMDKDNDPDRERAERQKVIVAKLKNIPSTFLIGADYEDHEVGMLTDTELHQQLFCLFEIDHTNRGGRHTAYDVDHLYAHIVTGRELFLTYEKKFVKKRQILKELGINISFPDEAVHAIQQASSEFPINSVDFRIRTLELIESFHDYPLNHILLKRLQNMRQAQKDIAGKVFNSDDEKVVRYLAPRYKRYIGQNTEISKQLFRQHYHTLKNQVLWHYPHIPITSTNIIRGILDLFEDDFDMRKT